ncbi:unnamed protein product [Gongylonema pulchrum]|uniref:Vesicle-fusing ATPase n=1 Tax=Gongylonema pulchrum TaxID=637853 RepID=A0A183ER56_9BILA|nr:unnamed protein product [Gongylonema pulchrum]
MAASETNRLSCTSLLLTGVRNSGKSCLAALIAKNSDIPNIHVYSPDDFLHMDEAAKVAKLHEIFKELSQFPLDLLLKTGKILDQSSNRLIVIATVTSKCAENLDLRDYFTRTIEVPVLTEVAHLMAVIEDSNLFDKQQCQALANRLEKESKKYSIGIKELLTDIELTKYFPSDLRLLTLLRQICYWKH